MNERHRKLLQSNHTALKEQLSTDIDNICSFIWSKGIISLAMKEDIEEMGTRSKKADKLLMLIPTRGSHAFDCLYEAAKASELWDVADILRPDKKPHQMVDGPFPPGTSGNSIFPPQTNNSGDNCEDDDLPMKWPTLDAVDGAKVIRFLRPADTSMIQKFEKSLRQNQEDIYVMKRRQRGSVLIINNYEFEDKRLGNRDGTHKDANALAHLFTEFGFNVVVVPDLTAQDMEKRLREEAEKKEHKDADCFILFILTHGHLGVVFGTDGKAPKDGPKENYVEIKTIRDLFGTSESLKGKPKLLFIQACQGTNTDSGTGTRKNESNIGKPQDKSNGPQAQDVPMEESGAASNEPGDSGDAEASEQSMPDTSEMSKKTTEFLEELNPTEQNDAPTGTEATPTFAHCFLAMATTADYVSWRHSTLGTWFIQAIVYIFAKYAYKYDLQEMMTMVNRLVSKGRTKKGDMQVAEKTDSFYRKFYFFPGLHREQ